VLTKSLRRKISEQDWLDIEKQESNPSQTWRRLKDQSITAINDLILLANKLPDDKQKEIFSPTRIEAFIAQILDVGSFNQSHKHFNARKSELAARLVRKGISLNVCQYAESSPDTPSLIKPTLDHLEQTISICDDISYNMKLKNIREEEEGSKFRYLFSWNNMLTREKNRLISFLISKTGDDFADILNVQNKGGNTRIIDFGMDTGDPKVGIFGTFQLTINNTYTRAEAYIFNAHHQMIWKADLLVKEIAEDKNMTWRNNLSIYTGIQDYGNDFNFYVGTKGESDKQTKKLKQL
jgi:hypothetical protein